MGCAPSCGPSASVTQGDDFDEFAPPPPIPVTVGNGVRKSTSNDKAVIFVFGGPGSQKGVIIEELTQRFDFVAISIDDIIFNYLPNKVANTVEHPSEVIALLKSDPKVLSLEWIFSMITAKLSTSYYQRFIVDVIPEISSLMKSDCFVANNHDRTIENFEKRNPIMFALELSVFDPTLVQDNKKDKTAGPQLSKELSTFMQGIDDIDKGRLQKRVEAYHRCALPFLRYFNHSKRVVKLTLNGPVPNAASTVRELLREFGFTLQRNMQRVVLFAMREHFFNDIDLDYYRLRRIRLSDVVKGRNESLITQLKTLQQYIERTASADENFAVHLDTLNTLEEKVGKRIVFYDKTQSYLDEFIKNKMIGRSPSIRERVGVHVMASRNDQVLLFLDPINETVVKNIGLLYAENSAFETTSPSPDSRTS